MTEECETCKWLQGQEKNTKMTEVSIALTKALLNHRQTYHTKKKNMMGRFRPQIALGIICATLFSCLGLWIGLQLEAVEIITAIIGGLFGFLGGVSLKVLENE